MSRSAWTKSKTFQCVVGDTDLENLIIALDKVKSEHLQKSDRKKTLSTSESLGVLVKAGIAAKFNTVGDDEPDASPLLNDLSKEESRVLHTILKMRWDEIPAMIHNLISDNATYTSRLQKAVVEHGDNLQSSISKISDLSRELGQARAEYLVVKRNLDVCEEQLRHYREARRAS